MFQICGVKVAEFCNCKGLNGLVVTKWKPSAAAAISSAGSQASNAAPWAAKRSRARAIATPDSAKPASTMEMTQ